MKLKTKDLALIAIYAALYAALVVELGGISYVIECCDVRMIESGHRSRFAFEPLAEFRLGDLQGDTASQPYVACFPDLTHASGTKSGFDFVGTEPHARPQSGGLHKGGVLHERIVFAFEAEQRLDFPPDFIVMAGSLEKRRTLIGRLLDGSQI